jgi:hypothetical protein
MLNFFQLEVLASLVTNICDLFLKQIDMWFSAICFNKESDFVTDNGLNSVLNLNITNIVVESY